MKQKRGAKNFVLFMIVGLCCLAASGCVYVVAGGVGALGGYALSNDTFEGETDVDYDTLWDASGDVLSIMGNVNKKDYKLGVLEATVNGSKVNVDLSQVSSDEVRLRVKARKNMLPNSKLAQDIFVKIRNRSRQ